MDFWGFVEASQWYFRMLWRSFSATMLSGTAMGTYAALAIVLIVVVLALYVLYTLSWRVLSFRRRRVARLVAKHKALLKGMMMDERERGRLVQIMAQDAVVDAFETLYCREEITLEEKDALYKKVAEACKWYDLARMGQLSKKEQIRARTDPSSGHYLYKKVNLPDISKAVKKAAGRFSGRLLSTKRSARA